MNGFAVLAVAQLGLLCLISKRLSLEKSHVVMGLASSLTPPHSFSSHWLWPHTALCALPAGGSAFSYDIWGEIWDTVSSRWFLSTFKHPFNGPPYGLTFIERTHSVWAQRILWNYQVARIGVKEWLLNGNAYNNLQSAVQGLPPFVRKSASINRSSSHLQCQYSSLKKSFQKKKSSYSSFY